MSSSLSTAEPTLRAFGTSRSPVFRHHECYGSFTVSTSNVECGVAWCLSCSIHATASPIICICFLCRRSLGQCSCICRAWNIWANEPHLWEHQIAQSYHRPTMLQHYSLLSQPQLMAASDGQANPAVYRSQAPAPAAANSTAGAGAPAAGKQLFIGALVSLQWGVQHHMHYTLSNGNINQSNSKR